MSEDEWTIAGMRVTDDEVLRRLRSIIEDESDLIVEHRFYRGARSPHRFICDDFIDLEHYLRTKVDPGDSFYFWRFEECCRDDNVTERGKFPDPQGRVPLRGVY